MHTWSEQLVPLVWCATSDDTYDLLRQALAEHRRGQGALATMRGWWIEQGVHSPGAAIDVMNNIARQHPACEAPARPHQYLQAPLQEGILALSGAAILVPTDLVQPRHDVGNDRGVARDAQH